MANLMCDTKRKKTMFLIWSGKKIIARCVIQSDHYNYGKTQSALVCVIMFKEHICAAAAINF